MSTGCEVNTAPVEYKSGEMRTDLADGDRARKVAFITGVTGQDGSYLVELLLAKGTRVDDAMRAREVDARRDVARGCGRSREAPPGKKFPHPDVSRARRRRDRRGVRWKRCGDIVSRRCARVATNGWSRRAGDARRSWIFRTRYGEKRARREAEGNEPNANE